MRIVIVLILLLVTLAQQAPQRITNGLTARAGQFPYQVGLLCKSNGELNFCGGVLIHNQWVLTAAHCMHGISAAIVLLGGISRLSPQLSVYVDSSNIFAHGGFNWNNMQNDIALIRLPQALNFTASIRAVDMPACQADLSVGEMAVATGWGHTSDYNGMSTSLQYAQLSISPYSLCAAVYGTYAYSGLNNLCTATPNYVSTCHGDSGGPLVLNSNKKLIGLTSYGSQRGCAQGLPVVYTNVAKFMRWISSVTGLVFTC